MEYRLPLFEGHTFLGGRGVAFRVRTLAEKILTVDASNIVVLDCDKVVGASHSFGDELLSSLTDLLGAEVTQRVRLSNCCDSLHDDLVSVADMHQLYLPNIVPEPDHLECA